MRCEFCSSRVEDSARDAIYLSSRKSAAAIAARFIGDGKTVEPSW